MLFSFFWVIPRLLNFVCRRFGTLCSIFIRRCSFTQPPAYEDGTERSETSAYKIQTPGNNPEESIQHLEHGESLKSRILCNIEYYIKQVNKSVQKSVTEPEKAWAEVYTYTNNHVISIWDCADGIRMRVSTLPVCLLARTVATHCDEQEQGGSHHKPSICGL